MHPITTLLLVDDRPENLITLEALIAAPGRMLLKALSGNEALQIAVKTPELTGLLLDVRMPDMDGFETAGLLRSNSKTAHLKVAFITADEAQTCVPAAWSKVLEPAVFLYKPLEIAALESLLKEWSAGKVS